MQESGWPGLDIAERLMAIEIALLRTLPRVPNVVRILSSRERTQARKQAPTFTPWGAVVARYPDGTPAVVEGRYGSGWLILSAVHPEAPADWCRGMKFKTPAETDNAYAAALIRAALNRESLPHY